MLHKNSTKRESVVSGPAEHNHSVSNSEKTSTQIHFRHGDQQRSLDNNDAHWLIENLFHGRRIS